MRDVDLNGADPEHIRLMLEGVQARAAAGLINLDEALALNQKIVPNNDYIFEKWECGCESNMVPKNMQPLINREDFCSHGSK